MNWYIYCGNNPLGLLDPMGLYGDMPGPYDGTDNEHGEKGVGGGGGGGGSDWHPDWSDLLQGTWDPFMNKRLADKHINDPWGGWAGKATITIDGVTLNYSNLSYILSRAAYIAMNHDESYDWGAPDGIMYGHDMNEGANLSEFALAAIMDLGPTIRESMNTLYTSIYLSAFGGYFGMLYAHDGGDTFVPNFEYEGIKVTNSLGDPTRLDCIGFSQMPMRQALASILGVSLKDVEKAIPWSIGFNALLEKNWIHTIDVRQKYSTIIRDVRPGDVLLMTLKGTYDKVYYNGSYCHMFVYAGRSAIAEVAGALLQNNAPWASTIDITDDIFTTEEAGGIPEIARTYNFAAYNYFRDAKSQLNPTYTIARIDWGGLINYTRNALGK
jgi:hypothetical protein